MLPDKSNATAMSMPLARIFSVPSPHCGRDIASTSSSSAVQRRKPSSTPDFGLAKPMMPRTS